VTAGVVPQLSVAAGLAMLAALALRRRTRLVTASERSSSPAQAGSGASDGGDRRPVRPGRAVVRLDSPDELAGAA
jgi:hypothetical protein